jgi:hypothetical protein
MYALIAGNHVHAALLFISVITRRCEKPEQMDGRMRDKLPNKELQLSVHGLMNVLSGLRKPTKSLIEDSRCIGLDSNRAYLKAKGKKFTVT